MLGHGSQKLFGWFSGPGLKGTGGFMENLGIAPGRIWGPIVAMGETSGGLLTLLGFLSPLGPFNIMAAMTVAMRKVHWPKGFWASAGGIEFPLTNFAAAMALVFTGPGRFSLDRRLGSHLPGPVAFLAALVTGMTAYSALQRPDLVENAVQTASSVIPGLSVTTQIAPDMERETRPQQGEVQQPTT
jgi:putative oxidoreductase